MTEQDPEPRVFVGIRLRPASLTEVDRIASRYGSNRSEVLRLAFGYGLKTAEDELRIRQLCQAEHSRGVRCGRAKDHDGQHCNAVGQSQFGDDFLPGSTVWS